MSWFSRIANVFQTERLDRDLSDELQFHLEERRAELIRRGSTPEEAGRQARRQFGSLLHLKEQSRDAKLVTWLESVGRDARFGLRMLRKDLGVTTAALVSLSLAMGACIAAFALIDALILRPLPVPHPEQLVRLAYPRLYGQGEDGWMSHALVAELRAASSSLAELFGLGGQGGRSKATFDDGGSQEEPIRAEGIDSRAFTVLEIHPALGRILQPADERLPARNSVAVISESFWMRRFGGNPGVLGQWFSLGNRRYQIVGVAQKGFTGLEPGLLTDAWFLQPAQIANLDAGWSTVWGRLKPGVAPEQLRQATQAVFTRFLKGHPGLLPPEASADLVARFLRTRLAVQPAGSGSSWVRTYFAHSFWILGAVAGLVLLIACSNVANLFVARAAVREREMAMRVSIGAGRGRLMQQLLIESLLLAAAACALGLAFAGTAAPLIVSLLAPADNPVYLDLHLDGRVLAFAAMLGACVTVLFGLTPALRASAVAPNEALKAGGGKLSARIGMLRPVLSAQVGFSFVVLFLGGLLLFSFDRLTNADLGFSKSGLVLLMVRPQTGLKDEAARTSTLQMLDDLRRMAGVQGASMSSWGLVGGLFAPSWTPMIHIPGHEREPQGPLYLGVSPGFFGTMRIPLLAGREFVPGDTKPDMAAVIVNQAFVHRYFPNGSPLGQRFERLDGDARRQMPQEIVGVVRNSKYNNIRETPAPTVYVPLQGTDGGTLEVRTAGDPLQMAPVFRELVERSRFRVTAVTLQSTYIDNTLLPERLLAMLSGFFALVAIVLAGVGLYGVLSFAVVRRTREIGIRLALGAQAPAVARLVIGDILQVTVVGLAAGLAGGFVLARLVATVLYEVRPSDAESIAIPAGALLAACAMAALPAIRRAVHVDPVIALRSE